MLYSLKIHLFIAALPRATLSGSYLSISTLLEYIRTLRVQLSLMPAINCLAHPIGMKYI